MSPYTPVVSELLFIDLRHTRRAGWRLLESDSNGGNLQIASLMNNDNVEFGRHSRLHRKLIGNYIEQSHRTSAGSYPRDLSRNRREKLTNKF